MTRSKGRPPGKVLYTEAFEALVAARDTNKKKVCETAGISPGFLTDLLACRAGASPEVVRSLAIALGCREAAIFPELAPLPWTSPVPDRDAKRVA